MIPFPPESLLNGAPAAMILARAKGEPLDALRSEVHAALSGDPVAWRNTLDAAGGLAVNLVTAALILVVTLWASQWAARLLRRALEQLHRPAAPDATLVGFLSSVVRWVVLIVGLMAVLEELGVQTTSILALLGAGSLAIGLAMQGALANVAAGVMLLVLRPYRVGEVVQINGRIGTVVRLDLFMTELSDPDNLSIHMPNGKVFGEMIVNFSTPRSRRMELGFNIDYADDLDQALALLVGCAKADSRVLPDPAPWSGVTALGDSAVTVTLRAWAPTAIFWDVRYDMLKRVKETLEGAGLNFAYPHQVTVAKPGVSPPNPPAGGPSPT
ncbi:MAG: mechanosensitive ion channel [Caulobacteraceae bacterium]|nr:mechanosensitive ion channel [Caulobacteraceae bacterium]